MQNLLIGLLVALGIFSYITYNQNVVLTANNIKLEAAVEEQQRAMDALRENFEKQGKAMQNMSRKNASIEAEKADYLQIFQRHNLSALAVAKPAIMTGKVNRATNRVFEGIEDDTKEIYNLDESNRTNDD
jgi:flagellar motility protein MotE (MotC chaperone)